MHPLPYNPVLAAVTFLPVGPDTEPVFFELFARVRSAELGADAWPPDVRDAMLRLQFDAQRHEYRERFPRADERLIRRGDAAIGWVIVDRGARELHGIDIALVPGERCRGIGTEIIGALQEEAAAAGHPMVITVQRFNTRAQALYARLGFRVVSEQALHTILEWRAGQPPLSP